MDTSKEESEAAVQAAPVRKVFTVQLLYNRPYTVTLDVEADSLDEALADAVDAADRQGEHWKDLDAGNTWIERVAEGSEMDLYKDGAKLETIPAKYGEFPVTMMYATRLFDLLHAARELMPLDGTAKRAEWHIQAANIALEIADQAAR